MQVQYSLCDLSGKSSFFLPGDIIVSILKIGPQRAFGAVFEDDAKVWIRCYCLSLNDKYAQKHDDIWVSDGFHSVTLAQKISQTNISILNFELFDNNLNFSPFGFINNSISAFTDLIFDQKFFPQNLSI